MVLALTNLLWLSGACLVEGAQTQSTLSPPSVTHEQALKALGTLFQVVRNVEAYVNVKELSSIHNEDMMLYGALTLLIEDTKQGPEDKKDAHAQALLTFGRQIADLHAAADANNQNETEVRLEVVSKSFSDLKKFYKPDLLSKAEKLGTNYTCSMHPDVIGNKKDFCPKCGMELDQNVRINLFGSGQMIVPPTTMIASVQTLGPLTPGVESTFYLRLRKIDQSPVLSTDLREVHTEKIHLLIIDPSLQDYHHTHPKPTDTPGSYSFTFTPQKKGTYRAWADIRSTLTGFQEYLMTEIPAPTEGEPLTDRSLKLNAKLEHLKYQLSFASKEIKVGQPVVGKLRITNDDGTPFHQLEPLMGMFAHIAGFNEDFTTVLHMHPRGTKLLSATDRGGPELEFILYATKPGFYRLFAQVQVGGISKFAPFGITIAP